MASRRSRPLSLLSLFALSTLGLAACEHDPADPGFDPSSIEDIAGDAGPDGAPTVASEAVAAIGEQRHAIHGAATFSGCSLAERNALEDALDFAQQRVLTADFRACVIDGFGVEADGRMVEELIADVNTLRGVDFNCVDGDADGANAGYDAHGNESMNIVNDLALNTDTAGLAAIIVHEITHNHGWWHNHFYGPTWPDQVQGCVFRGQPFGARRSDVAGARLLQSVGGEGGTYRRLRCGEEEAMVGIAGAVSGDRLVRLQPLCQDVRGSIRVGAPWTWGMGVPAGAAYFEDRCANGKAVVGLEGSAGRMVERVRAVCADIGDLRAFSGGVAMQSLPYHGRIRDWGYSRRCPERTVATGMRVRTGALVDGFQLECDDFPLHDRGLGIALSGHGGWGGSYSQLECPGTMGLDGVYGQRDVDSTDMASIGGRCRVMNDQGVAQGDDWGWSMAFTERAGRTVPTEADAFLRRSYCDDDEALVGLAIAADNIVGDVVAVCADLDAWMAGDQTTRYADGLRVRGGETSERVTCPSRQIAIALEARTGWLVDRIDLRCKAPDVAGNLTHRPALGGNGGTAYEEICPDGRPLIGLRTESYEGGLRWLNGRCGRHTDDGTSVVGPIDLPVIGGDEHVDALDDCPLGKVLVGLDVAHGDRLASWVRGICADEGSVRAGGAPEGVWRHNWRGGGGEWTDITASMCPDGEVVRGLHGRRGALQDQVGIVCGKVPLLPGSTARGNAGFFGAELHTLTIPEGFAGDLRLRIAGSRHLHPTLRLRRSAVPTARDHDASANGANGILWMEVGDLEPGRYYIEVSAGGIGGSYALHIDPI